MASPTKFYRMTQIRFWMWLCDKNLVTRAFLPDKLSELNFIIFSGFDHKSPFFGGVILIQVQ